jgi:hypothetical protein
MIKRRGRIRSAAVGLAATTLIVGGIVFMSATGAGATGVTITGVTPCEHIVEWTIDNPSPYTLVLTGGDDLGVDEIAPFQTVKVTIDYTGSPVDYGYITIIGYFEDVPADHFFYSPDADGRLPWIDAATIPLSDEICTPPTTTTTGPTTTTTQATTTTTGATTSTTGSTTSTTESTTSSTESTTSSTESTTSSTESTTSSTESTTSSSSGTSPTSEATTSSTESTTSSSGVTLPPPEPPSSESTTTVESVAPSGQFQVSPESVTADEPTSSGGLAFTGTDIFTMTTAGLILIAGGTALVRLRRGAKGTH